MLHPLLDQFVGDDDGVVRCRLAAAAPAELDNVLPSRARAGRCDREQPHGQPAQRGPLRRGQRDLQVRIDPHEPAQHPSLPSPSSFQGRSRRENQLAAGPHSRATCDHREDIQCDRMLDRQQFEVDDHRGRLVGQALQQQVPQRGTAPIDSTPSSRTITRPASLCSSTSMESSESLPRSSLPESNSPTTRPHALSVPSRPGSIAPTVRPGGRYVCRVTFTWVGDRLQHHRQEGVLQRSGRHLSRAPAGSASERPRAAPSPGARTARQARSAEGRWSR